MGDSYVIAIDFGTAFSGYAFNITTREEKSEPHLQRWGKEYGFDSPKTPTCILFNEDETCLSFGYEAKMTYKEMSREEAKKYYYFEDFKMALYSKELSSDLKIKAANGKSVKALKVFSESLRFLKEDALRTISSTTSDLPFTASDFTWVLTVPAIWDPSAKQFMRKAAMQAGIITEEDEEKLVIALEPEAASIWCKKLPSEGFISEKHNAESLDQSAGTQYIVVDCGGGTIDITVHEVLGGGALKERHKVSGNNLGGQTVDRKFKQFLREIFTEGVWDEFEQNSLSAAQRMMYEFSYLKQVDKDVQISCPRALEKLAKDKSGTENFVKSELGASWDGDFIKISRDKMRSFYDESLKGITENLMEIFTSGLNIKYILLVGGYAQSKVLQQHITDQFGHQCKVLCPFRAQEAILRGAVEFGRNPNIVASRKSSYTYGFAVCEKFDEIKHKKEKKFTAKGVEWSRDIFRKLVEEGEDLGSEETRKFLCSPAKDDQKQMKLRFFRSVRKYPVYVDDSDVKEEGSFIVDLTIGSKVKLEIMFGSTEITATGINQTTGKEKKVKIDFMTKDKECVVDGDVEDDGSVGSSSQSQEYIYDGADETCYQGVTKGLIKVFVSE
ncbi:heat shock 70 kDa protein 12A-like [Poecilia latipinna]|uniref:heat shock 70 kDa protein 12A-like n=3 Tax=Poecilia latipinna TaxID=48699 RepID=UPI00072DED12|nr:PREDICTED: heat shock 70 kDa protein 12A-like [Poecilia latipinna]